MPGSVLVIFRHGRFGWGITPLFCLTQRVNESTPQPPSSQPGIQFFASAIIIRTLERGAIIILHSFKRHCYIRLFFSYFISDFSLHFLTEEAVITDHRTFLPRAAPVDLPSSDAARVGAPLSRAPGSQNPRIPESQNPNTSPHHYVPTRYTLPARGPTTPRPPSRTPQTPFDHPRRPHSPPVIAIVRSLLKSVRALARRKILPRIRRHRRSGPCRYRCCRPRLRALC